MIGAFVPFVAYVGWIFAAIGYNRLTPNRQVTTVCPNMLHLLDPSNVAHTAEQKTAQTQSTAETAADNSKKSAQLTIYPLLKFS